MGAPSIPNKYWLYPQISGGMALDTHIEGAVNTNVNGTINSNVNANVTGDPAKPIATLLIGDPARPVATDSKVELLNLPRFTLQDIKDMMKVRVSIPNYSQVCFKLMGVELFSICVNGEAQVITEPYIPNAKERCEDVCCEPDTRPFPENRADNADNQPPK
jgi:hypothetical protein